MKLPLLLPICTVALLALLSACGKLDAPVAGTYRAYVKVRGGEVPFVLQVAHTRDQPVLNVVYGEESRPATIVSLQAGELRAALPEDAGTLQVTITRNALSGELHLIDHLGKPQTLPFAAELRQPYRFIEQGSTDNADLSGRWQLEAISPEHFSAPVTVQLRQRFDAVDGTLQLSDGKLLTLVGQVNGDELYLSALGWGRALLFKGKVNHQGELTGELWTNLSNAKNWVARRAVDEHGAALPDADEQVRKVALPWAIPVQ